MPRFNAVVTIDDAASAPPYVQIFEQVRALIERGDVVPGQTLPTVRQLAIDLGVAPNTVARAYGDLKAEGYVVSESRRLTRVAPAPDKLSKRSRRGALSEAVATFLASLASRGYAPGEIAVELRKRLATSVRS